MKYTIDVYSILEFIKNHYKYVVMGITAFSLYIYLSSNFSKVHQIIEVTDSPVRYDRDRFVKEYKTDIYEQRVRQYQTPEDYELERDLSIPERKPSPKNLNDLDGDGMPNSWEKTFVFNPESPEDALEDADLDGYTNLQEYLDGTDPRDPKSNISSMKIYRLLTVTNIYRKPVNLLFKGYLKLTQESEYEIQINWGDMSKTDIVSINETIRGYKIVAFEKIIIEKQQNDGTVKEFDQSYIKIQRKEDEPLTLKRGVPTIEKEMYADIRDNEKNKTFSVHVGSVIGSYKIIDITANSVLVSHETEGQFTLKLRRRV